MTTIQQRQAEVLRQIMDGARTELHTAMPGTIVSYDASAQTADIRPGIKRVIPAIEDENEDAIEALPILPSVPVAWPRAGDFFLHAPLTEGDGVLLVFCEADINAWLDGNEQADPGSPERHGLSGAVAIPGLAVSDSPIASASGSFPNMGHSAGYKIEFRDDVNQIRVGGSESLALAKGLQAIYDAISGAGVTSNDGGAAFKAAIIAALGADPNWSQRNSSVIKGA